MLSQKKMEKEMLLADVEQFDKTKQSLCKQCGGIKKMAIDKVVIPPMKWVEYGVACDAGCICK